MSDTDDYTGRWLYLGRPRRTATTGQRLTILACGCDNRLVGNQPNKWTTRINDHGQCEWIPPQLLGRGR